MKNLKMHRHGEVLLTEVTSIPKNAKLIYEGTEYIVGHSESGHHHVLEAKQPVIRVYELDNELYLDVQGNSNLVHKKVGEIHKTQTVKKGTYKRIIKQEFDYFTGLIQEVRD